MLVLLFEHKASDFGVLTSHYFSVLFHSIHIQCEIETEIVSFFRNSELTFYIFLLKTNKQTNPQNNSKLIIQPTGQSTKQWFKITPKKTLIPRNNVLNLRVIWSKISILAVETGLEVHWARMELEVRTPRRTIQK